MNDFRRRIGALALLVVVAGGVGACQEKLDGGAACPVLCPEQNTVEVRDTLLDAAVALDTSIAAYPTRGSESFLLLASRGDTLQTRAVVRFDTLTLRFTRGGADSAITQIDSATLTLRIDADFSVGATGSTIEAYDVSEADTATEAILALFRPDRLLGSVTLPDSQIPDSVKLPLSNAAVLAKIRDTTRLRVGLMLRSPRSAQLRLLSRETGAAPRLTYDPHPDTAVRPLSIPAESRTPENNPSVAEELTDFTVIARGTPEPPPGVLAIGGLPSRRSYLRFDVPRRLIDSSTVLRATLILTQAPNRDISPRDSFTIYPQAVVAGEQVTDLARAINILGDPAVGIDSLRIAPGDSGELRLDMVSIVRQWRVQLNPPTQRALVLRSALEGSTALEGFFYSSEATPAVRPRLRIIYVSRVDFGVP